MCASLLERATEQQCRRGRFRHVAGLRPSMYSARRSYIAAEPSKFATFQPGVESVAQAHGREEAIGSHLRSRDRSDESAKQSR
jgi:hypothetical protein